MIVIIPIVVVADAVVVVVVVMMIRIAGIARCGYRRVIIRRAARVVCGMRVGHPVVSLGQRGVSGCTVVCRMVRSFCTTGMPGTPTTTGFVMNAGIATAYRG